jgi:hypothetical protein
MTSNQTVAVFGAYGHTGRFVVSELVSAAGDLSFPDAMPAS